MAPGPNSTAYCINPSHMSSYPLSLLGNGSVKTFPRQRIYVTIEKLLDASFSNRSVSYQEKHSILPGTCYNFQIYELGLSTFLGSEARWFLAWYILGP
jgi:hypothetical protein